jgi:two-component system CheB/CheR fusion protein
MDVAPAVDSRRADTPAGKGERILVIEDNAQVRRAVVERLCLLGYDIRDVDRGSRAIPILKNDDGIRLVLSDVVMPGGMDGFDIADWVRANRPALKILLVSGNTGNDPRRAAHADLRVMTKPYAIGDLARALRDLLDRPG